jgi:pilus assembly protein CpaB
MALRNSVVPIVAALVLGVVAAVFATRWMQQRIVVAETSRTGTVPVVVAAKTIGFGDRIQSGDVKAIAWPKADVPDGTFSDTAAVVGRYSTQKMVPGELVLRQRAVEHTGGNLLSAQIEPSRRAVTVRVNDVIGVAGFLLPGNRVDVLATRLDNQRRAETRTLLQNLKVLAVDQTTAEAGSDKPVVVRAVTLEMSPEEAEQLVTATEEGSVQLALRNPEDHSLRTAAKVEPAAVTPPPPPPVTSVPRKQAPPKQTVTVIRQTQTSEAETQP